MKRLFAIVLFCVLVPCVYADTYVVQFPDTSKEQFRSIKQALKENFVAERKGVSTSKRELRYAFNGDIDDFVDELEESLDEASFSVGDINYDASTVIVEIEKFPDGQQATSVASNSSTSETLYRVTPHSKFVEGGRKWFTDGDETIHVKYVGEVKNGRPHGHGELFFKGFYFSGEFKDGKKNGQGAFTEADGRKYVGQFGNGLPNGLGTTTWANGDKYVGEYKDGESHGQGTKTWADGDKYVGQWKDDIKHGQGTYTWADGDKYVGQWKDGKQQGQGTYTWADGREYVGEWKDDIKHGQGTFTLADGQKYVGEWENSKQHGQGTHYIDESVKWVGEWKRGKKWTAIKYYNDEVLEGYKNGKWQSKDSIADGKDGTSSSGSSTASSSGSVTYCYNSSRPLHYIKYSSRCTGSDKKISKQEYTRLDTSTTLDLCSEAFFYTELDREGFVNKVCSEGKELSEATAIFPKIKKYFKSLNLNQLTCNPSGSLEQLEERLNAKDYWVRKYLQFHAEGFNVFSLLDWYEKTIGRYATTQEELNLLRATGILQNYDQGPFLILKCRRHAQEMCRRYGGDCTR